MSNEDPTNFEKNAIAIIIAMPGVVMISYSLRSDSISLVVGVIGIFMLSFGSILKGSIKEVK
jgi:hypothetical protein